MNETKPRARRSLGVALLMEAMRAMNPLAAAGLDLAALQPAPRKRKGKSRQFVKSHFSGRQQRQFYRSKYVPHQGKLEKCRRSNQTAWIVDRGTGVNRNPRCWIVRATRPRNGSGWVGA